MKLATLLLSLCALQCAHGLVKDEFTAKLKSGKDQLTCSFKFKLDGSEVSSSKVQCNPKDKKATFNNVHLKGNVVKYLISFRVNLNKVKVVKVAIASPCPMGFSQVCMPSKDNQCGYGLEEFCPSGEKSSKGTGECTCLSTLIVEAALKDYVNPLGSCESGCVCVQQKCDQAYHWGYDGAHGPEHWGDEFPACNGMKQSPINIVSAGVDTFLPDDLSFGNYDQIRVAQLGNTGEHYPGATRLVEGSIKNNGHTAQVDVIETLAGDVGVLSGGPLGSDYQVLQLHFHWGSDDNQGSEHTLDGQSFPMEMHIVHKKVGEPNFLDVEGGLAVTGFFFEIDDSDNAAIEPLVEALTHIMNPADDFDMSNSDFKITDLIAGVAPRGHGEQTLYSSYSGSLTTPGCMEIVNWINFIKPIKISSAQLAKFRMLKDGEDEDVVDNFRPTQPLNGRDVNFYQT